MAAGIYTIYAAELVAKKAAILAAWGSAESELVTAVAPNTSFRDIYFNGANIKRISDDATVSTLPTETQRRLYPQLDPLFKKAINAAINV